MSMVRVVADRGSCSVTGTGAPCSGRVLSTVGIGSGFRTRSWWSSLESGEFDEVVSEHTVGAPDACTVVSA